MPQQQTPKQNSSKSRFSKFLALLGPGLVTGAADDDPSGIVTYTQSGAQFGLGQLWTAVFMLPLMIAVQEMAARISVVTNKGIAQNIKDHYSKAILGAIVLLLLIANTINLGVDIGAMSESARLIWNLPFYFYAGVFFTVTLLLEIFVPYRKYAKFLKWLTISLFAYFITGIIVVTDWKEILHATFVPHVASGYAFAFMITGVLGTTISPYMIFWQGAQEIEEKEKYFTDHHHLEKVTKRFVSNMRLDTFIGMLFSEVTTWFIIVTAAVVLNRNGITNITTAAQAASALEPLVHAFPFAGKISEILFSIGIIGAGMLAIPIFAASSSYAVSEIFEWNEGLSFQYNKAQAFYVIIILSIAVGFLMNFFGFNPIVALIYTAVINGIVCVPIILMLILLSGNKKIMGKNASGPVSKFFSWATFLGMGIAAVLTIYGFFHK